MDYFKDSSQTQSHEEKNESLPIIAERLESKLTVLPVEI